MPTYDTLLAAVATGDMDALMTLYDLLSKPVYGLALSVLRDRALAEDVMQETFIRVRSSAHTHREGSDGKAWILRIARNLSLDILRRRKRESLTYNPDVESPEESVSFDANTTDQVVLKAALSQLDEKARQIVILHAVSGMTFREIAQVIESNLATVQWRYYRALKILAKYLDDTKSEEERRNV